MSFEKESPHLRRARLSDASRLADLAGQLGYPTTSRQMAARLKIVLRDRNATCFIAESPHDGVIGWIHVCITPLLELDRCAEVKGLVVDENIRSRGTGAMLLAAAEKWASAKRCKFVFVRSNILRERAHAFYLGHGYEHFKSQKAFRKPC